jgi:hypothetical protein
MKSIALLQCILEGKIDGKITRGRRRISWMSNIRNWLGKAILEKAPGGGGGERETIKRNLICKTVKQNICFIMYKLGDVIIRNKCCLIKMKLQLQLYVDTSLLP